MIEEEEEIKDYCTCGDNNEEHYCPYAEDIRDCYETCTCCDYCTHQCAMDI